MIIPENDNDNGAERGGGDNKQEWQPAAQRQVIVVWSFVERISCSLSCVNKINYNLITTEV